MDKGGGGLHLPRGTDQFTRTGATGEGRGGDACRLLSVLSLSPTPPGARSLNATGSGVGTMAIAADRCSSIYAVQRGLLIIKLRTWKRARPPSVWSSFPATCRRPSDRRDPRDSPPSRRRRRLRFGSPYRVLPQNPIIWPERAAETFRRRKLGGGAWHPRARVGQGRDFCPVRTGLLLSFSVRITCDPRATIASAGLERLAGVQAMAAVVVES